MVSSPTSRTPPSSLAPCSSCPAIRTSRAAWSAESTTSTHAAAEDAFSDHHLWLPGRCPSGRCKVVGGARGQGVRPEGDVAMRKIWVVILLAPLLVVSTVAARPIYSPG